jgi:transposase-like protein
MKGAQPVKRVPPSEETKQVISQLLSQGSSQDDVVSQLVRLGMRQIAEEALEGAVRDLLGRDYYERSNQPGYRNGYRRKRLDTAEGEVSYQAPQVTAVDASC